MSRSWILALGLLLLVACTESAENAPDASAIESKYPEGCLLGMDAEGGEICVAADESLPICSDTGDGNVPCTGGNLGGTGSDWRGCAAETPERLNHVRELRDQAHRDHGEYSSETEAAAKDVALVVTQLTQFGCSDAVKRVLDGPRA